MRKPTNCIEKRRKFAGAIGLSGTSVVEFAKGLDVSVQAIYQTLANPRKSQRLSQAIDRFISRHLPEAQIPSRRKAA